MVIFFLQIQSFSDENITEINKFIQNRENKEKVGYFSFFLEKKILELKSFLNG